MKWKKAAMVILAATLVCQPMSVFADAAPDGMTDASQTAAAQGGAWEAINGRQSKMTGLRYLCHRELMRRR